MITEQNSLDDAEVNIFIVISIPHILASCGVELRCSIVKKHLYV